MDTEKPKLKRMFIIHILEMLAGLILEGRLRRFHNHPAAAEEQRVRRWGWPGQSHSQCTCESAAAEGSAGGRWVVVAVRGLACSPWGGGIRVGSTGAVGVEVGGETGCMGMMGFLHFCPQLTEIW